MVSEGMERTIYPSGVENKVKFNVSVWNLVF